MSPESPSEQDLTKQPGSSFQPMLDLQRFQQFVAQEKSRDIENQTQFLSNGPGSHHVASHGHGNLNPGPDKPKAGPDIYPPASQPFVHPQAAVPSATDVQSMTSGPVAVPSVYDPQHVAMQGSLVSVAGQISEPSSFLSQKSTEVVAGGPNFVIPGTNYILVCGHCVRAFISFYFVESLYRSRVPEPSVQYSMSSVKTIKVFEHYLTKAIGAIKCTLSRRFHNLIKNYIASNLASQGSNR